MPISMQGHGRKNPDGFKNGDIIINGLATATYILQDIDSHPDRVNFDPSSDVYQDIGSPSYKSSGVQLYSLDSTLYDQPGGITGVRVERVANTQQNGFTYLTYQVTLSLDPTSSQKTMTVGARKPSVSDYAAFYFSDLDVGANGGIAIAGNGYIAGTTARDCLNGGEGSDTLDSRGGADYMQGGNGNDTYIVYDVNAQIDESPQTGIETVISFVDWSLNKKVTANARGSDRSLPQSFYTVEAATGLDNLILKGDAIIGNGNYLNNQITGNNKNNILNGFEAVAKGITEGETRPITSPDLRQKDTLTGGAGADTFVLGDASGSFYLEQGNNDYALITDFKGTKRTFDVGDLFRAGRPTRAIPGDKIQLAGDLSQYDFRTENRGVGQRDLDVAIYFTQAGQRDLVGVVQDTAIRAVQANLTFV
jgi:Ca2+-binding RTX toxin-like protein